MKPDISIVVAVYQTEKTIRKCVDSLLNQTFTNFEILLIDDGSIDNSGKICDDYALSDSRIRVIHKKNGGVSSARQCGIENALGQYTIHVDPDDWVETTMLEDLYGKAIEDDADMVICDFFENTYKGQKYVKQQPSLLDHNVVMRELFLGLHGSCCNKLIKRSCYSMDGVRFPKELTFCEDQYVCAAILKNNITISYLPKAYYHYVRQNEESLSRRYSESTYSADLKLRDFFVNLFDDTSVKNLVYGTKTASIVSRAFWGGEAIFSSFEFKRLFYKDRNLIRLNQKSYLERLLLYLSCCGLYQPIRRSVSVLKNLKKHLI